MQPKGVSAGDEDNQHRAAGLYQTGSRAAEEGEYQIVERSLLRREDAGTVHKHMAGDAGPQAAALPDNEGIQKTDDDGVAYLQQHAKGVCGVGKIYDMSHTEGHGRHDDGAS